MSVFMFYTFLKYNEETNFKDKAADFVWAFAFIILSHGLLGLYFGQFTTGFSVAMSLCWMFCKRNPEMRLSLYSFQFRAPTFPWALMVLNMIISQRIFDDILGILVGHLYVYLHDVVPSLYQVNVLQTPSFVKNFVDGKILQKKKPSDSTLRPAGGWGAGRRLGGPN
ncbi:Derlin-2/3 [Strigomonas culicis]|nr:Derlin-2/3 [Strigomonas culicis]|eukprot:EPY34668.1 Derlin-2/3 [Strigomonas culicis]